MLAVESLTKSYKGQAVLKGVSLELMEGESTMLLGANGAGKSTLLQIIMEIKKADSGVVRWKKERKETAFVPQSPSLITNLTVKQFVHYILSLYKNKKLTNQVLETAGLFQHQHTLTEHLSTGQGKKLMFALAAAQNPDLLIMDEPTAGMDSAAKKDFYKQVQKMKEEGVTILVTSHILEEVHKLADHFVYLEDGVLNESQKITELYQSGYTIRFLPKNQDEKHTAAAIGFTFDEVSGRCVLENVRDTRAILADSIQQSLQLKQLEVIPTTVEAYVDQLLEEDEK